MASITSGTPGSVQERIPRFDGWLLLSAAVLMMFGLMSLYSEGLTRDADATFKKQVVFTLIGLGPFTIFAAVHPKFWMRISGWLYTINVASLLAVLAIGSKKKGADRWIEIGSFQFQPSEMAKLLTVITLAAYFASRQDEIQKPKTFFMSFVHVLPPLLLIFMQPHLGATMVVFVSWFAICIVAGVPFRYLAITGGIFAAMGLAAFTVPAFRAKVLQPYQLDRIEGKVAKDGKDTRGKNWQTDRAEIAFGVGGVVGSGYLKGEQKTGHFIPEQHNDFVFTVIGEEGGLVGCTMVLLAFAFFFYRVWVVMFRAAEPFYRMIAGGIFAALFFHAFVNMGMVLQIFPVVGIWLPFLSYGGTALWLCMACVGLLLNIRRREKPILF